MDWYYLTLAGDLVAAGLVSRYQKAFEEAFVAARGPRAMALFQKVADGGGVELFLTPDCGRQAAQLLAQWGCVSCERPSLIGLQLLVGHNEITYYMP